MGKSRHSAREIDDALRLQHSLYASHNPTRKWLHNSRLQWITGAVNRYFPEPARGTAVDLGTGSGILLPVLLRHFQTVISMDVKPAWLDRIKQTTGSMGNIHYLASDARSLPIQPDTAGLIVCAEVLEHVDNDTACLAGIFRALKPTGILILSTPQPLSLMELTAAVALRRPFITLARAVYQEPVLPTGHINLIAHHKLLKKLADTGFVVLETHKSGLYLPGLAEIPSGATQKIAAALGKRLSGTKLDFLLWTQFFVARKP